MLKLWRREDLKLIQEYPKEVVDSVDNVIEILSDSYGEDRYVNLGLSGYVCITRNVEEVKSFKKNITKGLVEEYSDVICVSDGNTYSLTLYLISSDYSVAVISKNGITDEVLK